MSLTITATFHGGGFLDAGLAWSMAGGNGAFSGGLLVWADSDTPNGWSLAPVGTLPTPAEGATADFTLSHGDVTGYCTVPGAKLFGWFDGIEGGLFGLWIGTVPGVAVGARATRTGFNVTVNIDATPADRVDHVTVDWGDGDSEDVTLGLLGTATVGHTFAGPSSSTGITFSVTPTDDYPICLNVDLRLPPEALFDFTIDDEETDNHVLFDGSASYDLDGSIVSYDWTFGGAGTQGGTLPLTPDYIYDEPGTYFVTLTVTDNDGLMDEVTHSFTLRGDEVPRFIGTSADPLGGYLSAVKV